MPDRPCEAMQITSTPNRAAHCAIVVAGTGALGGPTVFGGFR